MSTITNSIFPEALLVLEERNSMFENAKIGIKKIYKAEVLTIIAAVIAIISGVVLLVLGIAAKDGNNVNTADVVSLLSLIVAAVLAIIAFFLNLFGIIKVSKDDESFKNALIMLIIGIVASIVSAALQSKDPSLSKAFATANDISELFVTYYVISGCISLALKKGNQEVADKGKKALNLVLVVWVITILVGAFGTILTKKAGEIVAGIIGLVAIVLSIIAYFVYLGVLKKTSDIL